MINRILRSPYLIAGVALAARLAIVSYYSSTSAYHLSTVWGAGYEMVRVAENLLAGQGFSSPFLEPTGPTAILPPGYPLLLSIIFRFLGIKTMAAAVAAVGLNIVLSAATCLLIFHFAKETVGETAGVVAAWIWALYLPVILSAGFHVWDGTLTTFLAALAYLLAIRLREGGWRRWALYGLCWGAGALVNPSLLAIYGVLFLWACWQQRRGAWMRNAVLGAVVLTVVIGPWAMRNYRLFHRVWPVRSNFGEELWIGNHEGADGYFHLLLYPLGNTAELEQYRRRGEAGYMQWKQNEAVAFIKTHPAEFVSLVRLRMSCFWGGVYDSGYAPMFLPTTILGLGGLMLVVRRKREWFWCYALPLIFYPMPYYLTHADLRFRFPIEPLLACLTGYAITEFVAAVQRRRMASAAATASMRSA